MMTIRNPFWAVYGGGTQAGAQAGENICDLFLKMNGKRLLKNMTCRNSNDKE
jgi:hypothetical protein